jgi:hypothetical protein
LKERGNWLKAQGAVGLKYARILLPILIIMDRLIINLK